MGLEWEDVLVSPRERDTEQHLGEVKLPVHSHLDAAGVQTATSAGMLTMIVCQRTLSYDRTQWIFR